MMGIYVVYFDPNFLELFREYPMCISINKAYKLLSLQIVPPLGWHKANFDGAKYGNLGISSNGGILKIVDDLWEVVFLFHFKLVLPFLWRWWIL